MPHTELIDAIETYLRYKRIHERVTAEIAATASPDRRSVLEGELIEAEAEMHLADATMRREIAETPCTDLDTARRLRSFAFDVGFRADLSELWVRWPELRERLRIVARAEKTPAKKRKRKPSTKIRALTPRQTEAVQLAGECKGNYSEVGRIMGVSPQRARALYEAASEKLGQSAMKALTARQALPTDRRGQSTVENPDDEKGRYNRVL